MNWRLKAIGGALVAIPLALVISIYGLGMGLNDALQPALLSGAVAMLIVFLNREE